MLINWIILNSVDGLGPVRINQLLEQFQTPEAILEQPSQVLAHACGMPVAAVELLHSPAIRDSAQRQIDLADRAGISILTLADTQYPRQLREIYAPPPVLFVKGNTEAFVREAVAVVGTRGPTAYGERSTVHLSRGLAQSGVCVVSGLALGVDALAHQACLDAGGWTIAVLGSGIDMVYPRSNRDLAQRILEHGAIVSEFPPGTEPLRTNFPRRNRIISGLSAGVLVVEAGLRSGSLITSSYALQQGRDVYAVPGSIFNDLSLGTFNLLKSGATPVRNAADITGSMRVLSIRGLGVACASPSFPVELLSDEERAVLDNLADTPLAFEDIAQKASSSVSELHSVLLNLELKGAVRQLAGQQFVRA